MKAITSNHSASMKKDFHARIKKLQQALAVIPGAKISGISSHFTFSGSKSIPSDGKLSSERSTQQELMSWLLKSWNSESRLLGGMRQDVLHESSGRAWYVKQKKQSYQALKQYGCLWFRTYWIAVMMSTRQMKCLEPFVITWNMQQMVVHSSLPSLCFAKGSQASMTSECGSFSLYLMLGTREELGIKAISNSLG